MKTDVTKLKLGDYVSRISFMEIKGGGVRDGGFRVENEDSFSWGIDAGIVANECYSANQYGENLKTPKTKIAEILMNANDAIIQVCFDKADGTERILTGYVVGAEPVLGRTIAIDIEMKKMIKKSKEGDDYDMRRRLVDHRTLRWLIYKNVRYFVK